MSEDRQLISDQIALIEPMDEIERDCKDRALDWLAAEEHVYRLQKPDVPKKHLVAYFVAVDLDTKRLLLVHHKRASLWLPTGGHIDPKEDPRETVRRECREELGVEAVFMNEEKPFFITATETNDDPGRHTDVSLWYLVQVKENTPLEWEKESFFDVQWWQISDILATSPDQFDPHFLRFVRKLRRKLA